MTTAADDATVEDAFEALLAGRPAPEGAAGLAAFTEAVRASGTSPGRPSAALADLLASGLLVDQSRPSTRTARSAGASPSSGAQSRIRRRFAMILTAMLAKVLAGGALAQAATGATVVVVAVTGAGAAGVLPGPVQDRFAAVVEVATPFEAPTSGTEPLTDGETPTEGTPTQEPADQEVVVEEVVDEEEAPAEPAELTAEAWAAGPAEGEYESFGAWVSAAAGNEEIKAALRDAGTSFGQVVSSWAREKGKTVEDIVADGVDPALLEDVETTDPDATDESVSTGDDAERTEPARTERGGRGHGSGNAGGQGNGNGNAGGNAGGNGNGNGGGRN